MCVSTFAIAQNQNQICDGDTKPVQVGKDDNPQVIVTTTIKNDETTTNNSGQHNGGVNGGANVKVGGVEINGKAGYDYKGKTGSTTNETGSTTTIVKYYRCVDDKKQTNSTNSTK